MLKPSHTARLRFRRFSVRLPRTLGNGGPYFAMILINAIGYGLFAPFSILYFHQVVGLSLPLWVARSLTDSERVWWQW
jgi:hypothetical protein